MECATIWSDRGARKGKKVAKLIKCQKINLYLNMKLLLNSFPKCSLGFSLFTWSQKGPSTIIMNVCRCREIVHISLAPLRTLGILCARTGALCTHVGVFTGCASMCL